MGPGFGQMNDLVIIQTSQGFAKYLLKYDKKAALERGVIIGNDARHNSSRFAKLAALAFIQMKIPVYYCKNIVPTPFVAFGVRHFQCLAGIVITASHNPKDDNGYKVYLDNGAQILSPHDRYIQEHILSEENQEPWPQAWMHELLSDENTIPKEWKDSSLIRFIYQELCSAYDNYIKRIIVDTNTNQMSKIAITTTAMHGVGHTFLSRTLESAKFQNQFPVELQKEPDPNFPTVEFPNPEEAGALDLAFETAKLTNSNLILAVDPDADRCAVAQSTSSNKEHWRVFTGNEIGSLLGWWSWHCFIRKKLKTNDPSFSDIPKHMKNSCVMISTAVSSKFLRSMSQIEGFQFIETLTGFKYMCNLADDLIKQGKTVLFAYEEAIGYMVDATILDKDGISAALQVAQLAAHISLYHSRTLDQHLDWLYSKYGFHYNINSYYLCYDQALIKKLFSALQENYPTALAGFKVIRVRDLNNGYDSATENKKAILPTSSSSFMVTFFTENDASVTIRTSGTEPKIKYYSEIICGQRDEKAEDFPGRSTNNRDEDRNIAKINLKRIVDAAIEHCLQPNVHNLQHAYSKSNIEPR